VRSLGGWRDRGASESGSAPSARWASNSSAYQDASSVRHEGRRAMSSCVGMCPTVPTTGGHRKASPDQPPDAYGSAASRLSPALRRSCGRFTKSTSDLSERLARPVGAVPTASPTTTGGRPASAKCQDNGFDFWIQFGGWGRPALAWHRHSISSDLGTKTIEPPYLRLVRLIRIR
jgi:hypothetical protein